MDVKGKVRSAQGKIQLTIEPEGGKFAIQTKAEAIKTIKDRRKSYKARILHSFVNDPEGLAADVKAWTLRTQASLPVAYQ